MKHLIKLLIVFQLSITAFVVSSEEHEEEYQFTQAELEQILAPIALYPDSLLTHILIAATYPLEIVEANRWLENNDDIETSLISDEIAEMAWDPSVKALVPFPLVIERLNDDLQWTQKLGDAFLQNETLVLSSIQSLRQQADEAGNLAQMDNMTVTQENDNIIIQSAEPEVIYVPYYDTRIVYGNWHWSHYPPVYWDVNWHRHHNHYSPASYGVFSWHPSVHISFNYFFNAFHWHNRHIVVFNNYKHAKYNYRNKRIVNSRHVKRWTHNPVHRRGVAYRSNHIKAKFYSSRPSISQSKRIRVKEHKLLASRQTHRKATDVQRPISSKQSLTRHEKLNKQFKREQSKMPITYVREVRNKHNETRVNNNKRSKQNVRTEKPMKRHKVTEHIDIPKTRIKSNSIKPIRKNNNIERKTIHKNKERQKQSSRNERKNIRENRNYRHSAQK